MENIRVICVDDANRPKEISEDKWPVKFEKYTIDKIMRLTNKDTKQFGILGVTLKEFSLDENNSPYKYYKMTRFKPLDSDEELLDILEREMTIGDTVILEKI